MSVKPSTLRTPESDLNLETRAGVERSTDEDPATELDALMRRLAEAETAASKVEPEQGHHCRDCWDRGRAAAMKVYRDALADL